MGKSGREDLYVNVRFYLTGLISFIIIITGVNCGGNDNPTGTDATKSVTARSNVGFGVSGLLFNNNLILYDRSRSNLDANELVLVPQMYFTNLEVQGFPVHGNFPRSQVVSGGVPLDGIPALTNPAFVGTDGVGNFLSESDMVIGLEMNGEARAYPHNVLWWHEVINDQIGGQNVTVTFCPLTGTALAFDAGTTQDRLSMIPSVESTWARWKELHPDTRVVAGSNSSRNLNAYPYGNYRSDNTSPLFPLSQALDGRFPPKRMVHGVLINNLPKAYPFSSMGAKAAINDRFADTDILVIFDQAGKMALSYNRQVGSQTLTFSVVEEGSPFRVRDQETGTIWSVEGVGLTGPLAGQQLTRLQDAYNAFWFAWAAFWPATEVFTP